MTLDEELSMLEAEAAAIRKKTENLNSSLAASRIIGRRVINKDHDGHLYQITKAYLSAGYRIVVDGVRVSKSGTVGGRDYVIGKLSHCERVD